MINSSARNLALWVDKPFRNDEIFNPDSPINIDDRLSPNRLLKEALAAAGWDCHTADLYLAAGVVPTAVLFLDIPPQSLSELIPAWVGKTVKLAYLLECEVIKPYNWEKSRHDEFDYIFTWSESHIDGKKYFKSNFSYKFPPAAFAGLKQKEKFCTLVAGNKAKSHPLELYSARVAAIRWFEANHPADFDLYGIGWDRYSFTGPRAVRALNRIKPLCRLLAPAFPSYRGEIPRKFEVMGKYKFSICYENAKEFPGYITEKIFDSMCCGCIPVYWGAPDIAAHVPEECFIDKRKFLSYESLYTYLKAMPDSEFEQRLSAINTYLRSAADGEFSDKYFVRIILERLNAL